MPAALAQAARLFTRHRLLIVAAVSGVLGFRLGMVVFPEWQAAVETAQVVAGVVQYPEATPFFIYHTISEPAPPRPSRSSRS